MGFNIFIPVSAVPRNSALLNATSTGSGECRKSPHNGKADFISSVSGPVEDLELFSRFASSPYFSARKPSASEAIMRQAIIGRDKLRVEPVSEPFFSGLASGTGGIVLPGASTLFL